MVRLRFVLQFDLHTQYIMKGVNLGLVIDQNLSYPSIKVYASGLAINSILKLDRLVIVRAMHELQMLTSPSTWPYTPK